MRKAVGEIQSCRGALAIHNAKEIDNDEKGNMCLDDYGFFDFYAV